MTPQQERLKVIQDHQDEGAKMALSFIQNIVADEFRLMFWPHYVDYCLQAIAGSNNIKVVGDLRKILIDALEHSDHSNAPQALKKLAQLVDGSPAEFIVM